MIQYDFVQTIQVASQMLVWIKSAKSSMAARAHYARGVAFMTTKRLNEARQDFRKALLVWSRSQHPRLGSLHVLLGSITTDDEQATALLLSGLHLLRNPQDAEFYGLAYFCLAGIKLRSGAHADALRYHVLAVPYVRSRGLQESVGESAIEAAAMFYNAFDRQLANCPRDHCLVRIHIKVI